MRMVAKGEKKRVRHGCKNVCARRRLARVHCVHRRHGDAQKLPTPASTCGRPRGEGGLAWSSFWRKVVLDLRSCTPPPQARPEQGVAAAAHSSGHQRRSDLDTRPACHTRHGLPRCPRVAPLTQPRPHAAVYRPFRRLQQGQLVHQVPHVWRVFVALGPPASWRLAWCRARSGRQDIRHPVQRNFGAYLRERAVAHVAHRTRTFRIRLGLYSMPNSPLALPLARRRCWRLTR